MPDLKLLYLSYNTKDKYVITYLEIVGIVLLHLYIFTSFCNYVLPGYQQSKHKYVLERIHIFAALLIVDL